MKKTRFVMPLIFGVLGLCCYGIYKLSANSLIGELPDVVLYGIIIAWPILTIIGMTISLTNIKHINKSPKLWWFSTIICWISFLIFIVLIILLSILAITLIKV